MSNASKVALDSCFARPYCDCFSQLLVATQISENTITNLHVPAGRGQEVGRRRRRRRRRRSCGQSRLMYTFDWHVIPKL